jgi:hypothetical protein
MLLAGLQRLVGLGCGFIVPSRLGSALPDAVYVSVMDNREEPGAQIATATEALPLFECPNQGIMNQIFSVIRIAHERTSVAPKRCELANDIEWAFFPFHE